MSLPGQTGSRLSFYISALFQCMPQQSSHTAILVFIRTAAEEAGAKDFNTCLRWRARRRVAALLNDHTRNVAKKTGLPVVVVTSAHQEGTHFGERFANALATTFQKGYKSVIAIGNDCLTLSPATIRQAAGSLRHAPFVFGPCRDGGVYLFGIHSAAFNKTELTRLPWQSETLLGGLMAYAGSRTVSLLPQAVDADDAASLKAALYSMRCQRRLKHCLENVLRPSVHNFTLLYLRFPSVKLPGQMLLRAPPAFLC